MNAWITAWPPSARVLRESGEGQAKEWALQALDRVAALAGRRVVHDSASVIGVLAAAGHVDEGVWQARLEETARKAGHRDVQRQVASGLDAGRALFVGEQPRSTGRGRSAAVPDPCALMAQWKLGQLTERGVWALVDEACRSIRNTRGERDVLQRIRCKVRATTEAARLVGVLRACGIVDGWARDAVVAAARAAGDARSEEAVDSALCLGYALAWEYIKDDELWRHLARHGWE